MNAPFSCSSCGRGWTGLKECHCAASVGSVLALRYCDTKMRADLDAALLKRTPNDSRIGTSQSANGLSAVALPVEVDERLGIVATMLSAMFLGRDYGQVAFGIVGLDVVDVMDVVIRTNGPGYNTMFIRFHIAIGADPPTEADVPLSTQVSPWFEIGDCLAGGDRNYLGSMANLHAISTETLLWRAGDDGRAISAWLRSNHAVILTQWGCHESFSTEANFDRHRVFLADGDWSGRRCLSPEELSALRTKSGKPVLEQSSRKYGRVWVSSGQRPEADDKSLTLQDENAARTA